MPPKKTISPGDAFLIPLSGGKCGLCRARHRDRRGMIFEVFRKTFEREPSPVAEVFAEAGNPRFLFVNEYSVAKRWKALGTVEIPDDAEPVPWVFSGSPHSSWILHTPTGDQPISPRRVSYDDMLNKGYVCTTFWAGEAVEAFLEGRNDLRFGPFIGPPAPKRSSKKTSSRIRAKRPRR